MLRNVLLCGRPNRLHYRPCSSPNLSVMSARCSLRIRLCQAVFFQPNTYGAVFKYLGGRPHNMSTVARPRDVFSSFERN